MRAINPRAARLLNQAASAYRQGEYFASAEAYRAALQHEPKPPHTALLDFAKPLEILGEWDEALDAIKAALYLSPADPIGMRRRSRLEEEKETFDALEEELRREPPNGLPPLEAAADCGVFPEAAYDAERSLIQAWNDFRIAFKRKTEKPLRARLLLTLSPGQDGIPDWAGGSIRGGQIHIYLRQPKPNAGLLYAAIRHEYAHAALEEVAPGRCPPWLEEALAEAFARPLMSWERKQLAEDAAQDRLVPFESMNAPLKLLPPRQAKVAYRQCAALGERIMRRCGPEAPARILDGLLLGEEAEPLLEEIAGATLAELQEDLQRGMRSELLRHR